MEVNQLPLEVKFCFLLPWKFGFYFNGSLCHFCGSKVDPTKVCVLLCKFVNFHVMSKSGVSKLLYFHGSKPLKRGYELPPCFHLVHRSTQSDFQHVGQLQTGYQNPCTAQRGITLDPFSGRRHSSNGYFHGIWKRKLLPWKKILLNSVHDESKLTSMEVKREVCSLQWSVENFHGSRGS